MIIWLVAHSDFLFSELCQPLPVDLDSTRDGQGWHLLVEQTGHVLGQSGYGELG